MNLFKRKVIDQQPEAGNFWPKDNVESWKRIHDLIEEYPNEWKSIARQIVSSLELHGLTTSFRIGQMMHDIIFSTLDYHGIPKGVPRVILQIRPKEQKVRVAYSDKLILDCEPISEKIVSVREAVPCLLNYLKHLWIETKPNLPIPSALNNL